MTGSDVRDLGSFPLGDPRRSGADSAAFRLGARRGLDACASRRGTFAVLALDHRQNLRKELHPDPWPGHEWVDSLAAVATGDLDMPAMVSHRMPLSDAPAVFAEIAAHRLVHRKIVFDPST